MDTDDFGPQETYDAELAGMRVVAFAVLATVFVAVAAVVAFAMYN